MPNASDISYMQHALRLAERGLGHTWPNPSVGAIIVKDGNIVGRGHTARGGRPHAEPLALAEAGDKALGATLYVTLEPCAHQGKTPPCTEAIIKAGIVRVVSACTDSNPKVAGKGFAQLRAAGIEVSEPCLEPKARDVNAGFFFVQERGRPLVMLKLATSANGKIAGGKDRWVTGEEARRRVHMLRASHDIVVTGIGTVLADDPELTCRLPGREGDSPQRAVLDTHLRISEKAKILPAWIFTSEESFAAEAKKIRSLQEKGSEVRTLPLHNAKLSLEHLMKELTQKGITRVMVEAGSGLASAFFRAQYVDRVYWFRSEEIIETGPAALEAIQMAPGALPGFALSEKELCGEDVLEMYRAL